MKTTIPPEALSELEQKVRRLMRDGQWQEGLVEIRSTASLYAMTSEDLGRLVAAEALEKGHVRPLVKLETHD